ncbi:MAG: hypothetical protein GXO70_05385 [Acidobacteria bacterium]|nr:hypothetical protein [Acidobacteriota bacterium]
MFFNTLKREMAIHYLSQVSLLVLGYFVTTPGHFIPERFGLFHVFGLWHQLAPLVLPIALILYVLDGWLILSALAALLGRPLKRLDFFMYISTSIFYLLLYLLTAVLLYVAFSPLITHLRLTALTEVPVLAAYIILLLFIAIMWKWLTYVKWRSRVSYFQQDAGFSLKIVVAGFSNAFKWKSFMIFLLIAFGTVGIPLFLLAIGAYLQTAPILASVLMAGMVCYTIGKFYLLYTLWNRMAQ